MDCKICGSKMWGIGGISIDILPPIHHDRYDCPNGHVLFLTHGEDTPTQEEWLDKDDNLLDPPAPAKE